MQLFPKNPKFFVLYHQLTATLDQGSDLLVKASQTTNGIGIPKKARTLELLSDELFHKIQYEADTTFITPFDREDMHALARSLNNILDLIENVISDIDVYKLHQKPPSLAKLTRKLQRTVSNLTELVTLLEHKQRQVNRMRELITLLHEEENEADNLIRSAISDLFAKRKHNPVLLMKWKDVYQTLEEIFDECERTADVVMEIIIKNY